MNQRGQDENGARNPTDNMVKTLNINKLPQVVKDTVTAVVTKGHVAVNLDKQKKEEEI